ncbi:Obg_CgtA GTPase family protein [Babesia bovis T2Bo]|uniref:Uncharacterized protein n=1 Tax=Babesia bovis TaxID=5865 RepID=A7AM26_BABBO|nr:Obg_CgtA GTPase family protein [Babesia bovis T2Bo]EDO07610.1 Obg_CgtA GTPase family protein [Babesia bovis T2Bo]|eukprot:XP_001611178.1 hypothetical protein [Babesia bovis T2Bo]
MSQIAKVILPTSCREERIITRPIVDLKLVKCIGGKGGDGAVVFSKHGPHRLSGPGLPAGGAGGKGGNVYAIPMDKHDHRVDLRHIPGAVKAPDGTIGNRYASGRPGNDVKLKMPLGTLVYKLEPSFLHDSDKCWRQLCWSWKRSLIADINDASHSPILLARGGCGGRGNTMRTPYHAEYGGEADEGYYEIELKSIADIGLVGLPNVGKSTLLSAMTRANSKIAAYPFTTIAPCIGYIMFTDGKSISVADLPGIVTCRFTQDFFRHIERTKALLYVIDVCNATCSSIEENFASLREQIHVHGSGLSEKPFVIVVTKMDVNPAAAAKNVDKFCNYLKTIDLNTTVIPTSAKYGLGIASLIRSVRGLVETFARQLANRVIDRDDEPLI